MRRNNEDTRDKIQTNSKHQIQSTKRRWFGHLKFPHWSLFVSCILFLGYSALHAAPATSPATTTASLPSGPMSATVEDIHGFVRVRTTREDAWKPAAIGMQLPEGAEIQTSMHSSIRCTIPPDQFFVLDRATTVRIGQAIAQNGKIRTDLQMKYGRTQFQIEAAGLEHQATISSPGSTLAIRGTTVMLTNTAPFPAEAVSFTGRARFINAGKESSFGGPGAGRMAVNSGQRDVAYVALAQSVVDPRYQYIRTDSEKAVIAQQVARGALLEFDQTAQIPVIRNSTPIVHESDLVPTLPGKLDFVARWTTNSDVNLSVFVNAVPKNGDPSNVSPIAPVTEFVYPGFGLNHSASGGTTAFDDRGGPHGGTEIVYWKNTFPTARYGISLNLVSGAPADVTLNVFVDGKKQHFVNSLSSFVFQTDANGTPILVNGFPTVLGFDYPTTARIHLPFSFFDPFAVPPGFTKGSPNATFVFYNPDTQFLKNLTAAGTTITDTGEGPADLTPSTSKASTARALPASAFRSVSKLSSSPNLRKK
jgi:hypothetical protein